MRIGETSLEQAKQLDMKTRIRRLRAEGKTYREIASIEHVSISQISRVLNKSNEKMSITARSQLEESFEKQVFRLLNQDLPPNVVIAKLGRTSRVMELWEEHKKIMQDDYSRALGKIKEHGFKASGDSKFPLTWRVERLLEENRSLSKDRSEIWRLVEENAPTQNLENEDANSVLDVVKRLVGREFTLKTKLSNVEEVVKTLQQDITEKDEAMKTLTFENSRLRKYQYLTDAQIKSRRNTLQWYDERTREKRSQLYSLNLQIKDTQHLLLNLYIKAREAVKNYLSTLNNDQILSLVIEALNFSYLHQFRFSGDHGDPIIQIPV